MYIECICFVFRLYVWLILGSDVGFCLRGGGVAEFAYITNYVYIYWEYSWRCVCVCLWGRGAVVCLVFLYIRFILPSICVHQVSKKEVGFTYFVQSKRFVFGSLRISLWLVYMLFWLECFVLFWRGCSRCRQRLKCSLSTYIQNCQRVWVVSFKNISQLLQLL